MTFCGSLGGLFFKLASSINIKDNSGQYLFRFIIGAVFYGSGAILNIYVLKHLPYTIVYPLTSITYIWTLFISYFLLKENITWRKVVGLFFIILGSFILV